MTENVADTEERVEETVEAGPEHKRFGRERKVEAGLRHQQPVANIADIPTIADPGKLTVKTTFMKVIFPKTILHSLLSAVEGAAAPGNSNSEILKHVLIEADPESGVAIVATNTDLEAIARSTEPSVIEGGTCLAPLKLLQQIVATAGDEITLLERETNFAISTDGSYWTFTQADPDLFPDVQGMGDDAAPIPTKALLAALKAVTPAMGRDDTRPSLMMIKVQPDGLYTSDGVRAHYAVLQTELDGLSIPHTAVKPLTALLNSSPDDYAYISITDTHIMWYIDRTELHARLTDLELPNIRNAQIEPRKGTHTLECTFSKARMITALKRANIVSDGQITLRFGPNAITVMATDAKAAQAATKVDSEGYTGPQRNVTYSAEAIEDLISTYPDDMITIRLSPATTDGSIYAQTKTTEHVILPKTSAA